MFSWRNLENYPQIIPVTPSALKHCNLCQHPFTLKVPIMTAQTTFINTFSFFSEKIRLDISCESSARQRIHTKLQALFASKSKSKKIKVSSAAIFVSGFNG